MPFITLNSALTDQLLSALCNTLLHSLWQGIVLAALAGVIIVFTKKASPALRYNLLCAALLLFALATVITFLKEMDNSGRVYKSQPVYSGAGAANSGIAIQAVTAVPVYHTAKPTLIASVSGYLNAYHNIIVLVWFLIICAKSIQLGMGLQGVYQLKKKQVFEAGKLWNDKLAALSERLQIRQKIGLLESGMAKVPMVIGHLKPVILIPIGLLTALSTDEVEAILIHELAHIRRRDYMVNLLQSLMEVVFFFNPAVLWVSQLIKAERENCCDDIAVAHSSNKMGYIRALVSCQEYQSAVPAYAMGLAGHKSHLVKRVSRMLSTNNNSLNVFEKSLLTICVVVAGLCMSAYAEKDHIKQVAHAVVMSLKPLELNKQQEDNLPDQEANLNEQGNLLRENTELLNKNEPQFVPDVDTNKLLSHTQINGVVSNQPESQIKVFSTDSGVITKDRNVTELFGRTHLKYGDFDLNADYVRVDKKNNLIFASGLTDPRTKKYTGKPVFKNGNQSDEVTADSLVYNYQKKIAKIYNSTVSSTSTSYTVNTNTNLNYSLNTPLSINIHDNLSLDSTKQNAIRAQIKLRQQQLAASDKSRARQRLINDSIKQKTNALKANVQLRATVANPGPLAVADSVNHTVTVKPNVKYIPLAKLSGPLANPAPAVSPYNGSAYKSKPYHATAYKPYNAGEEKARTDHMIDELLNDHLIISKDAPLSFKLDDKELIVNGKKVPDDLYQKYRAEHVKVENGQGHWAWMHNFDTKTETTVK